MGLFKNKETKSSEAKKAQHFAERLIEILSNRTKFFSADSNWELIFGFLFFFGGIFFLINYFN